MGLWVNMLVIGGVLRFDCGCLWADFLSMMSDCGLIGGVCEVLVVDCNCLEANCVGLWVSMWVIGGDCGVLSCDCEVLGVVCECL